jgi:carbonic anhydrase
MNKGNSEQSLSRRRMLQLGLTGTAAALVTGGLELAIPQPLHAADVATPDAALAELMAGNKRYLSDGIYASAKELDKLRQDTLQKQKPFAAVLSCADSRVPAEIVFDQTIGSIFVTRIAGNVATSEIIGSLEYGAAVLGTKVIMVMGHSACGAVKATMEGKEVPGQISSLFPHIQPAVDQAGHNLEAAIKANAKIQAGLLREASTVLSGMSQERKVKIVAGYYDLGSGVVSILE